MTLFHADLSVGYGWSESVLVSARLPYDVKEQRISYRTLDGQPFDPPYGDIHHRTESPRGIGDGEIDVSFAAGPDWVLGAGVTLPFGRTEPDPIDLGRRGLKHEHIQFGSGTFDPTLAAQWSRPFGRVRLGASVDARIPLYENSRGFRPPATVRWAVGPAVAVGSTGLSAQIAGQYQAIGKWNGEQDEGTGFHNGGVSLRASFVPFPSWRVTPGFYREIYSRSLSDETFRQGTTWSLVLTRFLSN